MKKLKLYTALAVTAFTVAGTAIPVQAAETKMIQTEINGKKCYIQVITSVDWCIPDNEKPVIPEIPEQPEIPDLSENLDTSEQPDEAPVYADQIVCLVNEERAKAGFPELAVDTGLEAASLVRVEEIVSNFSHTRPDGTSFTTAIREQNVSFQGAGENIAWGQKSPGEVMDAWMNSPGHKANILNASFNRIGVEHYQNGATDYWVRLFAY